MLHLPADVPHTLHGGRSFKMILTILKRSPISQRVALDTDQPSIPNRRPRRVVTPVKNHSDPGW